MTIPLNKYARQLLLLIALLIIFLISCAPKTTTPAAAPSMEKSSAVPDTDNHPTLEPTAENRVEEPVDVAPPTSAPASATAPAAPSSYVIEFDPAYSNKFSSMTKFNLLESNLEPTTELNLLVRTNGEPNTKQLKQLEETGANVRTIADDIITVTTTTEKLNDIAALDFVVFIEVSLPLYPESSEEYLGE